MKTFSSPYFGSKKKQIGVVKANVKSDGSSGGGGGGGGGAGSKSGSATPDLYLKGSKSSSRASLGNRQNSADIPDKDNTQISFGSMPSYRYNCHEMS